MKNSTNLAESLNMGKVSVKTRTLKSNLYYVYAETKKGVLLLSSGFKNSTRAESAMDEARVYQAQDQWENVSDDDYIYFADGADLAKRFPKYFMTDSALREGIQMKLTKLQKLVEGAGQDSYAKVNKIFDPLHDKLDAMYEAADFIRKQLQSAVLNDVLKDEGFPATEAKAAKEAAQAALSAVQDLGNELDQLHQAIGMHFDDLT